MRKTLFSISIAALVLLPACGPPHEEARHPEPCSDEWNRQIEARFPTGDGHGHGPDVGGDEWRSVVEFKLGIRGQADVPDRGTEAWCEYIDEIVRERDRRSSGEAG